MVFLQRCQRSDGGYRRTSRSIVKLCDSLFWTEDLKDSLNVFRNPPSRPGPDKIVIRTFRSDTELAVAVLLAAVIMAPPVSVTLFQEKKNDPAAIFALIAVVSAVVAVQLLRLRIPYNVTAVPEDYFRVHRKRCGYALMVLIGILAIFILDINRVKIPQEGLKSFGSIFSVSALLDLIASEREKCRNARDFARRWRQHARQPCWAFRAVAAAIIVAGLLSYLSGRPSDDQSQTPVNSLPSWLLFGLYLLVLALIFICWINPRFQGSLNRKSPEIRALSELEGELKSRSNISEDCKTEDCETPGAVFKRARGQDGPRVRCSQLSLGNGASELGRIRKGWAVHYRQDGRFRVMLFRTELGAKLWRRLLETDDQTIKVYQLSLATVWNMGTYTEFAFTATNPKPTFYRRLIAWI